MQQQKSDTIINIFSCAAFEPNATFPTLLKRYDTVQEVADLIAFLASEKAAYITGQNIWIDGGITRSV